MSTARASLASRLRPSRAQWVRMISAGASLARLAAGEAAGEGVSAEALAAFGRELRHVRGETFPDGERIASTGLVAEAFVNAARAFVVASPERRSEIAPALGALARLLDGFLAEQATAATRGSYWTGD